MRCAAVLHISYSLLLALFSRFEADAAEIRWQCSLRKVLHSESHPLKSHKSHEFKRLSFFFASRQFFANMA